MKRIVIMQPYFIPWYGFFEQISNSDIYVFYDDVQFVRRSLISRVDIKTRNGTKWLSIPIRKCHQQTSIINTEIADDKPWKKNHLRILHENYKETPYYNLMESLASEIYSIETNLLSEFLIEAILKLYSFYIPNASTEFYRSSKLNISGRSSQRLLNICKYFGAQEYITGLGALKYIDYDLFENQDIRIMFMDYAKAPYNQLYGEFNPYVSILDLIANTGIDGINYMKSKPVYWKHFIKTETALKYLNS